MSLLNRAKSELMESIAKLTNPNNSGLRGVVEGVNPEDIDLTTLAQIADDLRKSSAGVKSVQGNDSAKR